MFDARPWFISVIVILLSGCTAQPVSVVVEKQPQAVAVAVKQAESLAAEEVKSPIVAEKSAEELPTKVELDVAFASQAPKGDWGLPYQEACEEAALIQARKYFYKEKLDKAIMDAEIKKVVEWEMKEIGWYTDTALEEVRTVAEGYFDLDVEISENVSAENIKKQLAQGFLVLAPTAGRELHNPNFKQPGPIYHFVVIRGYKKDKFIVNDVGTRKGEGYVYDADVLLNAIHDLPIVNNLLFRPYEETTLADSVKQEIMLTGVPRILIVKGVLK